MDFLWFGVLAAVGWGTGDFLTARSARKTNPQNAWVWSFLLLSMLWIVFGLLFGKFVPLAPIDLALVLSVGLFLSIGDFFFLSAAKTGKIAVASPLFSLSAVVAVILGLALLGDRPSWIQVALALTALAGGVLIGLKDLRLRQVERAAYVLAPGIVLHGIGLTLVKVMVDRVGALGGTVWFEAFMLAYLLPFVWLNRSKISGPLKENAGAAAAYFIGVFAFVTALTGGFVSLVAPVANLFPLVVVGLAVIVYGEKLQQHQWAGIGLAALALAGLSAY